IAEGAEPAVPPVDGIDDPAVISAWKVLRESPSLTKNIAIIGGGAVGLETALFVASKGTISPEILHFLFAYDAETPERLRELMFSGTHTVTVFEMLDRIGKDVGKSTKWIVFDNIKRFGIKIITGAKVLSIAGGKVIFEKDGVKKEMQFGNVILASGSRAVKKLSSEVSTLGIPFTTVGDCITPGRINDAIHGGFLAALKI
ncbi:MAG: NADH:flavin oxidoreductase, partial [Desulfobacteraceae bacterium]